MIYELQVVIYDNYTPFGHVALGAVFKQLDGDDPGVYRGKVSCLIPHVQLKKEQYFPYCMTRSFQILTDLKKDDKLTIVTNKPLDLFTNTHPYKADKYETRALTRVQELVGEGVSLEMKMRDNNDIPDAFRLAFSSIIRYYYIKRNFKKLACHCGKGSLEISLGSYQSSNRIVKLSCPVCKTTVYVPRRK